MTYNVIQWGTGTNGQSLVRAVARHPDLKLVGCRVWNEVKNGMDAGVISGIEPLGVLASTDRQALINMDADVVLFCPNLRPDMTESDQDVIDLLRSGKNVISVSGAHSMVSAVPNGYGDKFVAACRDGGSTFAAAGINPGFIAERLAPTITGLCADVESVRVQEVYLCADDTANLLFDTMGFGRELDTWTNQSPVGQMFNHLFLQLVHNMARSLDVELAEVKWTAAVAPAHRDIQLSAGLIKKGTVAAITQSWEGIPKDPRQIKVSKHTRWVCASDIPGYPVHSGWQIYIAGKPSLVTEVRFDPDGDRTYHPEAMVGSAIPVIAEVMVAPPGILLPNIYAPFKRRFVEA